MVKSQARSISRIMTCGKTCHRMAFYACSQQFLTGPCYSTAPLANAPPWPCRQRTTPELAQLDTSRAGSRPGERRAAHLFRYPRNPSLNDRNERTGAMTAKGRVSRRHRLSATVRNCTRDEGGPFETGSQVQVSSHRKLLSSRAMVASVAETSGPDPGRQG